MSILANLSDRLDKLEKRVKSLEKGDEPTKKPVAKKKAAKKAK